MQSALTLPRVKSTQDEENHDKYQKSDWQTKVGRQRNVIPTRVLADVGQIHPLPPPCQNFFQLRTLGALEVNSMHTIVALEYRNDVIHDEIMRSKAGQTSSQCMYSVDFSTPLVIHIPWSLPLISQIGPATQSVLYIIELPMPRTRK